MLLDGVTLGDLLQRRSGAVSIVMWESATCERHFSLVANSEPTAAHSIPSTLDLLLHATVCNRARKPRIIVVTASAFL